MKTPEQLIALARAEEPPVNAADLARRTGYSPGRARAILTRAGVPLQAPGGQRQRPPWRPNAADQRILDALARGHQATDELAGRAALGRKEALRRLQALATRGLVQRAGKSCDRFALWVLTEGETR